MDIRSFLYVKKQKLSRYLSLKLSRNRTFTAMQLMLKTLETNQMLPQKLIALELFGFIGTSTTMDYQDLAEYIEMWELNPYYAAEAKKNIPKATVVCGDSIKTIKEGEVLRKDYNFIVIDPNSASTFDDGSYESFGVFNHTLKYIADEAVIFVTIYSNLKKYASLYGNSVKDLDPKWINARKEFFQMENVIDGRGIDYLKAFDKIIIDNKMNVIFSQFLNRNECVGFGVFVIKKNKA